MAEEEDKIQVPLAWVGVDELPVLMANQILAQQIAENELVLTFGQVAPPILLGTAEQKREQMRAVTFAAVRPVARVGMTRQRAAELRELLDHQIQAHDDQFGEK